MESVQLGQEFGRKVRQKSERMPQWVPKFVRILIGMLVAISTAIVHKLSMLIAIIVMPFLLWLLIACIIDPPYYRACAHAKIVKRVGGCDLFGICGIEFEDGSSGTATHPAPNQAICMEYHWVDGGRVPAAEKWRSIWDSI